MLLLTRNLKLHGIQKFRDQFVGPFTVLKRIRETAYRLDLSSCVALHSVHNVFHVSLLWAWHNNGVHADVPPIEIDVKVEYKVSGIKGHHEHQGEI